MQSVAMVDYIGYGDEKGEPLGHPLKVLKEMKGYINEECEISIIAPYKYIEKVKNEIKISLPFFINAKKCDKNFIQNAKMALVNICNIWISFRKCKSEIMWFYNVNQFLFFYLFLFGKGKKKVVVTIFHEKYNRKIYNFFLEKTIKKINFLIVTNKNLYLNHNNQLFIPDYLYDEDIYNTYRKCVKKEQIIFVGTINSTKEVEKLVEIFGKKEYPLKIYGIFYEETIYHKVMEKKGSSIEIRNEYLSYEAYKKNLGQSKYCVLPYNMSIYNAKTSGVILEAIFMNVIPIAPRKILEDMEIPGIAYDNIKEIESFDFEKVETEKFYQKYDALVKYKYAKDIFKDKLVEAFKKI